MLVSAAHSILVRNIPFRANPKVWTDYPLPVVPNVRSRHCGKGRPENTDPSQSVAHIGATANRQNYAVRSLGVLLELDDRSLLPAHFRASELAVDQRPYARNCANEATRRADERSNFLPFHKSLPSRGHQTTASAFLQGALA